LGTDAKTAPVVPVNFDRHMGQFSKWLLHEDQKELFDYLFAVVLNVSFLAITGLLLWPMGHAVLVWRFTKGYWVFYVVLFWRHTSSDIAAPLAR